MATTLVTDGRRVYFADLPFAAKDRAKAIGARWDADRRQWWVGSGKKAEAETLVASLAGAGPGEAAGPASADEADDWRVYAKVLYKGSNWFVIAESHAQGRCRICKLSGPGRWVDMADCEVVKTYHPRQDRSGAYGRSYGPTVYTTLGSLREFVASQQAAESAGLPACAACGKRGQLHHDLEDGLDKCYGCCDMPE